MCDQRGIFDPDERYAALKRAAPGNRQEKNNPGPGGKNPRFFKVSGYVQ